MLKRGLSGIVTTIILILISISGIIIIFNFVRPTIEQASSQINTEQFDVNLKIVPSQVFVDILHKRLSFTVERKPGKGKVTGLVALLEDDLGNSQKFTFHFLSPFKELETKSFLIDYSNWLEGNVIKISIFPIISINDLESVSRETDNYILLTNEKNTVNPDGIISDEQQNNPPPSTDPPFGNFRDLANKVLVLYNTNDNEALEIANYYIQKRKIDPSRLCGVQLPTGQFATEQQMLGARKTIIEDCICQNILGQTCTVNDADLISQISPITHLAIIRGIPPRLTQTGFDTDAQEPSLDFYLSYLIYNDIGNVLTGSLITIPSYEGATNNSMYRYLPSLNASQYKNIAYGRIEAITKDRTKELIDRTLSAENQGISGNFLVGMSRSVSVHQSRQLFDFFSELSSSLSTQCTDYQLDGSHNWPYQQCRTGATFSGNIPGESSTTIPIAINAGIFLGNELFVNGISAFDGFNNMINWHKQLEACTALCKDLPTQQEINNCRANSKDCFKEINTECVGVAPGFIGWQLRSWPVQYYGFFPPGWHVVAKGNGATEKTAPVVLDIGGYTTFTDTTFTDTKYIDTKYLHFGSLSSISQPTCTLQDGSISSCPEKIAVNLLSSVKISPAMSLTTGKEYNISLRYRNAASPGGNLKLSLSFFNNTGDIYTTPTQNILLDSPHTNWALAEKTFNINSTNIDGKIKTIALNIESNLSDNVIESLDLDAVKLTENISSVQFPNSELLDTTVSSFNGSFIGETNRGDYPANAIDRLGGIGWWGSSSHHQTDGFAFTTSDKFAGAFYSGRTLGESLYYTTKKQSGIIYGDPIYNPVAVKIYLKDFTEGAGNFSSDPNAYCLVQEQNNFKNSDNIYINVLHGVANKRFTKWSISSCNQRNISLCNSWSELYNNEQANMNAVYELKTPITLGDIITNPSTDNNITLRLQVWNPGDESNNITNYAHFNYFVNKPDRCDIV